MSPHIRILHVAAASALLWPEVQSIWAYVISSWRRLFSQRAGAGGGFELRTAPCLECRPGRMSRQGLCMARHCVRIYDNTWLYIYIYMITYTYSMPFVMPFDAVWWHMALHPLQRDRCKHDKWPRRCNTRCTKSVVSSMSPPKAVAVLKTRIST